jgi:cell wall-associated NlpC family hydrolase
MTSSHAAAYRHRAKQLRRRYRRRARWARLRYLGRRGLAGRRSSPREILMVAGAAAAAALYAGHAAAGAHAASKPPAAVQDAVQAAPAAVQAIAYAKAQLGCPYQWGGTGPCSAGYDCSGLVWAAYRSAGVAIPRTSEAQWAGLPHITAAQLEPGDLILYAGSDGTATDPGHVVMYIGDGTVIQAFTTGTNVMLTPLADVQAGPLTGYARP